MTVLTLATEGQQFRVDYEVIKVSKYIRNLADNLGLDTDSDAEDEDKADVDVIPVQEVTAEILAKVLEWCEHYHEVNGGSAGDGPDHQPPAEDDDDEAYNDIMPVNIDAWERAFLNTDAKTVQGIIKAANFLDIKPLLRVGCKAVAELVRGRSPQEIIDAFNAVQSSK